MAESEYLKIEEIKDAQPLGFQLGVYPPKTVPDSLHEHLFGQPEVTDIEVQTYGCEDSVPQMRTYAILDNSEMPYLLQGFIDESGLLARSLYQGRTQEDLDPYSPYLVELTEDNDLTKRLLTGPEGVNGLWDKDLGIYIRSRMSFNDVRTHFRKFTRVQDGNNKWHLFSFWKPSMLVGAVDLLTRHFPKQHNVPLYSKLLGSMDVYAITKGRCFKISSKQPIKTSTLTLDVSFFEFLYVFTQAGIDDTADVNLEDLYYDLPRLWSLGIRDRTALTNYHKIKRSKTLTAIAESILTSKTALRSSKDKTINHLSRFA